MPNGRVRIRSIHSLFMLITLLLIGILPASGQPPAAPAAAVIEVLTGSSNIPASSSGQHSTSAPQSAAGASNRKPRAPTPSAITAVEEIKYATDGLNSVRFSKQTGLVSSLSTRSGYSVPGSTSGSPEARARGFMESYGRAFGINDPHDLKLIRSSAPDEVGMEHVRLRQTHRGVEVTGGDLTLHLYGSDLVAVNAKTVGDLDDIDVTPTIDAGEVETTVLALVEKYFGITDAELSEPRLEIFNQGLLEGWASPSRLTWFVEATKIDLHEYFWIDAVTGIPLLNFSQLAHAKYRAIYDADDSTTGSLVRSEGGPPVVGGAATDANAAYDYSGDTYDYFFNEHGRDSYDDAGATLNSLVRVCFDAVSCPYPNASWNSGLEIMIYGAGYPAADDVVAHELTHAVTNLTANLFYYMQSGALNESYSDIFGETVDLGNASGTDTAGVRWQIGEDVPGGGTVRNMMDPTLFVHPGKMSDTEFWCLDSSGVGADNGGVHLNSGVPNHAYALMVDGGTYNGKTVIGLGLTKAGKIQYRTLTYYLTSASDFLDNYNALQQSCQDLIGVAGITGADCNAVTDALDAVEMSSSWPCAPAQASTPAFCPAGQALDILHFMDFDSSPFEACPSGSNPSSWCTSQPSNPYATSGVQSLWGYNQPVADYMSAGISLGGTLPANAWMQFNHSFGFGNSGTNYWDGGLFIYSINSGSNWFDGGSLISDGQAYGGTIATNDSSNPLRGSPAFVRDSYGYTASQLNLSSLAGGSFSYGFAIGTDSSGNDSGWFVDDVRIYTCSTCQTSRVLTNAHSGTAALYQASSTITAGSGFTVGVGESVLFEAGTSVTLQPGFSVSGGTFAVSNTSSCP